MKLDSVAFDRWSEPHAACVAAIATRLAADQRIIALAVSGSLLSGELDCWSDIDLVVIVGNAHREEILADRWSIAETAGDLLAAFSGEHVGEPQILICLFDDPLMHVDLHFVSEDDVTDRQLTAEIIWSRVERLPEGLKLGSPTKRSSADPQWLEDRFWVWVHYIVAKIGRGELFEVIDAFAFLRRHLFVPLWNEVYNERLVGVRKIESSSQALTERLRPTVTSHSTASCLAALHHAIDLYRELRPANLTRRDRAEAAAVAYLARLESETR